MIKSVDKFKVSTRVHVLKPNHVYRVLFVMLVVLMLCTQQAVAITPGINNEANPEKMELSQLGTSDNSDLQQLINGLRAFSRSNYSLAAKILLPLANRGISEAQFYMGLMADAGLGTDKDIEQAFHWYLAAARAGHPSAQHNLAVAYADGDGVAADPAKAVLWWQRAANQGNADAQYNLGIVYAVGKLGVARDMDSARKWWQKAAENGDGMAQYNLGILYANAKEDKDRGVCEAARWWKKSAKNGVQQAGVALEMLKARKEFHSC